MTTAISPVSNEDTELRGPNNQRLCGAKTKGGGRCKKWAMTNGRCSFHGGRARAGVFSHKFKTGRHSKYLPTGLQEKFITATQDPDLLNLSDEIALADGHLADLLSQLGEANPREGFTRAWGAFKAAIAEAEDPDSIATAMATVEDWFDSSTTNDQLWAQILNVIEARRRLVDTERRRRLDLQNVIDAGRALTYAKALSQAVKENVSDPETLTRINERFKQLLQPVGVR